MPQDAPQTDGLPEFLQERIEEAHRLRMALLHVFLGASAACNRMHGALNELEPEDVKSFATVMDQVRRDASEMLALLDEMIGNAPAGTPRAADASHEAQRAVESAHSHLQVVEAV